MRRFLAERGQLMSSGLELAADTRPSIASSSDSSFAVAQNNTTHSQSAHVHWQLPSLANLSKSIKPLMYKVSKMVT